MNTNIQIFELKIPEYAVGLKPKYSFVGEKIDKILKKHFDKKKIALRCLSLQDHPNKSVEDLVEVIINTGTDKYDPTRKMSVSHEFYKEKGVETFASPITVNKGTDIMNEIIKDFYEGALGDRGCSLRIDIIIIYNLSELKLIPIQYDDGIGNEAFKFKHPEKKSDSILGLIKIL